MQQAMCGKFTQMLSWAELVELADLQSSARDGGVETVTPMRFASVIARDDDGRRKAVRMRWGLVPPGVKDPYVAKPHIHARAESIDSKPTFRDAFLKRRGLVAVTTFNEGREITPTRTEQHILTPLDGQPAAIAVVWERWSERQGSSLLSFAMVTVPPNELIGTITDRMPALIEAKDWAKWLGEVPASIDELKALLRPSGRGLDMRVAAKPASRPKPGQPELF
jgi:putative SOS response-associated peptidase YedK